MEWLRWVSIGLVGYFLGNISFGLIIARRAGIDLRAVGSHNTGASNVLRVLGKRQGITTFVGDFFKAAVAVLFGLLMTGHSGALLGGLCCVIGHNWPVFYRFKGGKGIACSCAVLLICSPLYGGISIALCLLVIILFRYISLGSLTMLTCFAILTLCCLPFFPDGMWALALFAMGAVRHHTNIARLLHGTENRIGKRVDAGTSEPKNN